MYTMEEKLLASKLFDLLYNGSNIHAYNGRDRESDALHRFCGIVREFKQHMKEIENGQ